ncbi:phage antirepressor N-terminal domain-containing protein [Bordetella bronchiseptica]
MNQITPTSVEFHDATLFVATINAVNYVAIKPISDALGLEWSAQFRRIKRHPVLTEAIAIMAIPSTGGEQKTLALRLDKLNGWLFGVSINRVRPEFRERLIQYQRECFDVLAQHFGANNYGTPRIDPARLHQAQALAAQVAGVASRTVFKAVLASDDDIASNRWMFGLRGSYGRSDVPDEPWASVVPRDACVASLKELAKMINAPNGMMPTDVELAHLAAACIQRLSARLAHRTPATA